MTVFNVGRNVTKITPHYSKLSLPHLTFVISLARNLNLISIEYPVARKRDPEDNGN